ncbi:MAG: DUF3025 domain-containing protein, partial [Coxiellaceae bacterium]|nr:DUF3025 domain-containing protein [Coxiellaceae bacterium]
MNDKNHHDWDPNFTSRTPLLGQFHVVIQGEGQWPQVADYHRASQQPLLTHSNLSVHFNEMKHVADNYEKVIYETGMVPTRPRHWHDYFNALAWLNFPKTKAIINYLQYHALTTRTIKQRSPLENMLTLFDENGAIVCTKDAKLLDLLRNHDWLSLFYEHAERVQQALQVTIFGHSLHEKALSPYLGMTAHCLL